MKFGTLFHMSIDSHKFLSRMDLEGTHAELGEDGRFRNGDDVLLPLYEAKMIHQFDHRFATYESLTAGETARDLTSEEHTDPGRVALPRYWVPESEVTRQIAGTTHEHRRWFIGFRDIARNNDERTAIFTVVPWAAVGHTLPVLFTKALVKQTACFLGNANSFVFDYTCRQKLGGTHLALFIVKQLPVLPPETYTQDLLNLIVPRVLELTYTAHDLSPFARDLGYGGPPFVWDEERRAHLRADLDGIYAHLYGISRDDFAYILDTFPIVARNDIARHGEFRTKRLCLAAYDHFAPETLRALELQVRDIEHALRRLIARALANDPAALPATIRTEILEERTKHRPTGAGDDAPPLRDLLESAYLRHLDKIVRSDAVWPEFASRFGSPRDFKSHFFHLNAFRNPLAHGRGVAEDVRQKGEAAIAWFHDRLDMAE